MIEAIILAGGKGSRLASLFPRTAKALVPVDGRPFLDHLTDYLLGEGVRRMVLAVGHLHEQLEAYARSRRDVEFAVSAEDTPLGTGGALRIALPWVGGKDCLVLNGDSICRIAIAEALAFHASHDGFATLVATRKCGREDGGNVALDDAGRVVRFLEKAVPGEGRSLLSAGMYVIRNDPSIFEGQAPACSLEYDILPKLALRGACRAFVTDAPVIDIGTPERYRLAQGSLSHR